MITPVILAGGGGTRLWPMSRQDVPKQMLKLNGTRTMLAETVRRFGDRQRFAAPLVMTSHALAFAVSEQLHEAGHCDATVVLEPVSRNTGPALAAASLLAMEQDADALLMAVPSDHSIERLPEFHAHIQAAVPAARRGRLVTFSIPPTRPECGYGYILGGPLSDHAGVFDVSAFIEKPDAERACRFLAAGNYYWNSGMLLFSARTLVAELESHAPAVLEAARRAVAARRKERGHVTLDGAAFAAAPSISIDYAVLERSGRTATIPCDIGWSDLGCWDELWAGDAKDNDGNVAIGDVLLEGARDCYIRSERRLVAVLGVDDLVVVESGDAVLVMPRQRAQEVRRLVDRLNQAGRREARSHAAVTRPWGGFQPIRSGERFQVKLLTVKPGAKLSLQLHHHRAEHWVVVNGTALATCDGKQHFLRENESIYIPAAVPHRLENPGRVPLNVIEVQTGSYLEEDDIVRLEDSYGRVEADSATEEKG